MQSNEIKKLVRKYKFISTAWLTVFLLFAILANWFLINSVIQQRYELGLEYESTNQGYLWGAISLGLLIVLQLFFYSLEKILCSFSDDSNQK